MRWWAGVAALGAALLTGWWLGQRHAAQPRPRARIAAQPPAPPADERREPLAMRKAKRAARQTVPERVVADRPPAAASDGPPGAEQDLLRALETLGYVDGLVEAEPHQPRVSHLVADGVSPGLTLLSIGGHPMAVLVDAQGQEVHRWTFHVRDAWPDFEAGRAIDRLPFRAAMVLPGGDLLGLWAGYGMFRIDKDSNLVWATFVPAHHAFERLEDGRILVLTREAHEVPRIKVGEPILEDFIVTLSPHGEVLSRFSVLEAFEKFRRWDKIWATHKSTGPDIFHTNAISRIGSVPPGLPEAFQEGRLITSMRHLDAIAVIDPETEAVVWAFQESFRAQHDPQLLPSGRLLVFDNKGGADRASRLLEYDLVARSLAWTYEGSAKEPFATPTCGEAQRLDNGNTLVAESSTGRAFEIDREGRIMWSFHSPYRTGQAKKLVGRLYEVERLPPALTDGWVVTPPAAPAQP